MKLFLNMKVKSNNVTLPFHTKKLFTWEQEKKSLFVRTTELTFLGELKVDAKEFTNMMKFQFSFSPPWQPKLRFAERSNFPLH